MNKLRNILFGIVDGILPNASNSIKKTNDGQMEVNKARLISAVITWTVFLGVISGKIDLQTAIEIVSKLIQTAE